MYDNGCFFTKTLRRRSREKEDQEAFYVLFVRPGSGSYGCAGVVFRMGLLRRNQPQAICSVIIGLTIKVYQLVGTRWAAEGSTARARCGAVPWSHPGLEPKQPKTAANVLIWCSLLWLVMTCFFFC